MTNRPISPLPADYKQGVSAQHEIAVMHATPHLFTELFNLSELSLTDCNLILDWAMRIRILENGDLDWAECLFAAQIFYFG